MKDLRIGKNGEVDNYSVLEKRVHEILLNLAKEHGVTVTKWSFSIVCNHCSQSRAFYRTLYGNDKYAAKNTYGGLDEKNLI